MKPVGTTSGGGLLLEINRDLGGLTMKAISLWQPWASLMQTGAKTIETRSRSTNHRGPLLICAAKRMNLAEVLPILGTVEFQAGLAPLVGKPLDLAHPTWAGVSIHDLPLGVALAVVNLVDCRHTEYMTPSEIDAERPFGDFTRGRYAWITTNLRPLVRPVPVVGHQFLFNVDLPEGTLITRPEIWREQRKGLEAF